jgi:hypothetical protein
VEVAMTFVEGCTTEMRRRKGVAYVVHNRQAPPGRMVWNVVEKCQDVKEPNRNAFRYHATVHDFPFRRS